MEEKTEQKNKGSLQKYYPILVLLFVVIFSISNYAFLKADRQPPSPDESLHLINSLDYYYKIFGGKFIDAFINGFDVTNYPPLAYFVTTLFYKVFGTGLNAAVMSQFPFWIILALSVYFMGKRLWNPLTGLLGAVASLSFPCMQFMSHEYFLDVPTAALTALTLLFLFESDVFKKPLFTTFFFFSLGLTAMVKWTAVVYLIGPVLIFTVVFIFRLLKDKKERMQLIITALSFIGLCILLWFLLGPVLEIDPGNPGPGAPIRMPDVGKLRIDTYVKTIIPLIIFPVVILFVPLDKKIKAFFGGAALFLILIWNFYPLNIKLFPAFVHSSMTVGITEGDTYSIGEFLRLYTWGFQGIPLTILTLAGIITFFKDKKSFEKYVFMGGFIAALILLFSLPNKDNRYMLPLVIFSAPIALYPITLIKIRPLKTALIVMFAGAAFIGGFGWFIESPILKNSPVSADFSLGAHRPDKKNWKSEEVSAFLTKSKEASKPVFMFIETVKTPGTFNMMHTGAFEWLLFRALENRPRRLPLPPSIETWEKGEGWERRISPYSGGKESDFDSLVIVHVKSPGDGYTSYQEKAVTENPEDYRVKRDELVESAEGLKIRMLNTSFEGNQFDFVQKLFK